MSNLTQERLREFLHYDPESGAFWWKVPSSIRARGERAGSLAGASGYRRISIKKKSYAAHRLAWLYIYGTWPTNEIDHINGVRDDNRIKNLRDVSGAENLANREKGRPALLPTHAILQWNPPRQCTTLTHSRLKEMLYYDAERGGFTWRKHRTKRFVGMVAGYKNDCGYNLLSIRVGGVSRRYYGHRLAWFYTFGRWPEEQIDHINGNRFDNRLVNLREATHQQNCLNTKFKSRKFNYLPGTFPKGKKWIAKLHVNSKQVFYGCFATEEAAHNAYLGAKSKYHNEFARVA